VGLSNVALRRAALADMLRFMVWVSAVATLLPLSLLIEGPARIGVALGAMDLTGLGALGYIAGVSTLAGFAAWGALIRRYDAATVAPFSMLVPFFGMGSAAVLLDERLHATDLVAGTLVVGGVLLGAAGSRRVRPSHESGQLSTASISQVASAV
jgi:O-acetylserine/cysteine efflux transporter